MPKHPQQPHLVGIAIDGVVRLAVRAMSLPEARDYYTANHLQMVKLTASQAFALGSRGDVEIENAKPEYADAPEEDDIQQTFWDGRVAPDADADSTGSEVPHG